MLVVVVAGGEHPWLLGRNYLKRVPRADEIEVSVAGDDPLRRLTWSGCCRV